MKTLEGQQRLDSRRFIPAKLMERKRLADPADAGIGEQAEATLEDSGVRLELDTSRKALRQKIENLFSYLESEAAYAIEDELLELVVERQRTQPILVDEAIRIISDNQKANNETLAHEYLKKISQQWEREGKMNVVVDIEEMRRLARLLVGYYVEEIEQHLHQDADASFVPATGRIAI